MVPGIIPRNVSVRETIKDNLGYVVAGLGGQCRFDRVIFVLAHMRCGSTALSNILCSRPDVSGYGEAHIAYRRRADLGKLMVNQARRRAWAPRARWLFDKILHSRHDRNVPDEFFRAKAIFLARSPAESVSSIRKLFAGAGKGLYQTDAAVADYYEERLAALITHWHRFPSLNRVGLTYATLIGTPDAALSQVSEMIGLDPPLRNDYRSHAASHAGGGGDPTQSWKLNRIERRAEREAPGPLEVSAERAAQLEAIYAKFQAMIAERP